MSYKDNILKVRAEFINTLNKDSETISDKKVDQKKIQNIVYNFIFDKVFEQKEDKKEIDKFVWQSFCKTVDFLMDFGFIILNTLARTKGYRIEDLEEQEKEDDLDA